MDGGPNSGMADDATVLSTGSEGWVADAEREQRGPLAPKPPTCQSCNQFAPYRLTPQGQKHLRQLEDSGFLELCSLCIKRDPGGQRLFEHGSLFGDTAPAPPKPAGPSSPSCRVRPCPTPKPAAHQNTTDN